jgi:hypothetical protein
MDPGEELDLALHMRGQVHPLSLQDRRDAHLDPREIE